MKAGINGSIGAIGAMTSLFSATTLSHINLFLGTLGTLIGICAGLYALKNGRWQSRRNEAEDERSAERRREKARQYELDQRN